MFTLKLNEVLASKKSFISDRLNLVGFGVSCLLNIIHWLLLYGKIKPGSENILLQYNVIYGPEIISKSFFVYFLPLLALIMLIVNFSVASNFYNKEKLSSYFLSWGTVAIQAIILAASLAIINVNV